MRRFGISPRRAMPKGHNSFISYIASLPEGLPTSTPIAFVAHMQQHFRHADVRSISVHTEEITGSIPVSPTTIYAGQIRIFAWTANVVPVPCQEAPDRLPLFGALV